MYYKFSQRFVLIGLTFLFSKLILFVAAWFLSPADYLQFNKVYYTASTLTLFGSLGFSFALVNAKTKDYLVYTAVLFNIIVTSAVLVIGGFEFSGEAALFNSIVLALGLSITGIYSFVILYTGDYKRYFILSAVLFLLQGGALVISRYSGFSLEWLFTFSVLSWYLVSKRYYMKGERHFGSIKDLYRQGISVFVINSAAVLALTADKFFMNHYFNAEIANAYTFAWSMIAPLFYVGNVLERIIFSINSPAVSKRKLFFLTAGGQLAASVLYGVGLFAVVHFLPMYLPKSVSYEYLTTILPVMVSGYALFTVLHTPTNGILLKYASIRTQEKTAIYFTGAVIIFFVVMLSVFHSPGVVSFYTLLFLVWGYLFILTAIRFIILRSSFKPT